MTDQHVTLSTQLPARTTAYETSDVRPQINGIVAARLFEEGEDVRQGQPLYRIEPAPYAAAVASAQATLAGARAAVGSNVAFARRLGELVELNAAAKQDYENAKTSAEQSVSSVAAAQAALRSAQINLAGTTIRAPISGRIGPSEITTGALVHVRPDQPALHDPAPRPDLCRHPAIQRRHTAPAAGDALGRPDRQ